MATKTQDFYVVRYVPETPLHLAVHMYTIGRYPTVEAAEDRISLAPSEIQQYMRTEERTEEWEDADDNPDFDSHDPRDFEDL